MVKLALSHRQLDSMAEIEPHSLLTAPGIDNDPTHAHAYLFLADTKASPSLVRLKELLGASCASGSRRDSIRKGEEFYA